MRNNYGICFTGLLVTGAEGKGELEASFESMTTLRSEDWSVHEITSRPLQVASYD